MIRSVSLKKFQRSTQFQSWMQFQLSTQFLLSTLVLIGMFVLLFAPMAAEAQATKDEKVAPIAADKKTAEPTVAFINSKECPVCAKVRPIIKDLEAEYAGRVRFINLDISDDKTKAESKKLARSVLLGQFFNLYSDSFPCVGIFDKQNRTIRELCGFNSKEKYEGYIRKALNESLK